MLTYHVQEKEKKSNDRFVITRCLLYGFCDRDHMCYVMYLLQK